MSASHASAAVVTSTDGKEAGEVPGLLEVLAQVPDPRKRRGRRYVLVFVLAVAVACVLAGAKSFREIGDQAADLPQEILARLGGKPHPLLRRIIARARSGSAPSSTPSARRYWTTSSAGGYAPWRMPAGRADC